MNSIILSLFLLFVLLISSSHAGKMVITNQEDFEDMVAESQNMGPKTTFTPQIDENEKKMWEGRSMQVDKPDMKGRPCEQILFMTLLDACSSGGCTTGRQHLVEKRICKDLPMSDDEIKKACCPDQLSTETTPSSA
ncbi:hypothetical protein CAEBREN_05021 [Caenorhabditis brenneri]|uniref:Uncharacterized protein n=1 Tax=Caenorhabditis brenneri TaxID=135651 RepID=G0NFR9_CAEBE|nr:hypothetical protein CAEBREN_05021 [Caenorhabditis brenneri]